MLNCPLAGILEDEVLDATEVLAETVARYVGDPAFSNLPRKWKTSMSGCVDHCTEPEIDDISFVGVVNEAGEAGYDLRSEEHTSELQSCQYLVCRLLLEKKKQRHRSSKP